MAVGLVMDPPNNQLPFGLIAQLVEHFTGIAEVRIILSMTHAWIFQAFFSLLLK